MDGAEMDALVTHVEVLHRKIVKRGCTLSYPSFMPIVGAARFLPFTGSLLSTWTACSSRFSSALACASVMYLVVQNLDNLLYAG